MCVYVYNSMHNKNEQIYLRSITWMTISEISLKEDTENGKAQIM